MAERGKSTDDQSQVQKTRPAKGEPIEIPIPTESQIAKDFLKVALAKHPADEEE